MEGKVLNNYIEIKYKMTLKGAEIWGSTEKHGDEFFRLSFYFIYSKLGVEEVSNLRMPKGRGHEPFQ